MDNNRFVALFFMLIMIASALIVIPIEAVIGVVCGIAAGVKKLREQKA